jgi:hypothetical protein
MNLMIMQMVWTTSLNCGHKRSYCSFPMIYEYVEPWWNDIGRVKLLTRPPEHSGNPAAELPSSKAGGTGRKKINLVSRNIFVHTSKGFFVTQNLRTWSRRLYFPSERRYAADFYRPLNPSPSAVAEPMNRGSNGKHASHYTTEDDCSM